MSLAMTRPSQRHDSTVRQYKLRTPTPLLTHRKGERIALRLPDDCGAETIVTTKFGDVIKLSLRTREPELAKLRCAAINLQIDRLTKAAVTGPQSLSHRDVVARAGE